MRGFISGLTAVLVFIFLAGFFGLLQSQTTGNEYTLVQLQAMQVFQRQQDAEKFSVATVEDALLDAAVRAKCAGGDFCAMAQATTSAYLAESGTLLSADGMTVSASYAQTKCDTAATATTGYDKTFTVEGKTLVGTESPNARKKTETTLSLQVDVNHTATMPAPVKVLAIAPAGFSPREVRVSCQ